MLWWWLPRESLTGGRDAGAVFTRRGTRWVRGWGCRGGDGGRDSSSYPSLNWPSNSFAAAPVKLSSLARCLGFRAAGFARLRGCGATAARRRGSDPWDDLSEDVDRRTADADRDRERERDSEPVRDRWVREVERFRRAGGLAAPPVRRAGFLRPPALPFFLGFFFLSGTAAGTGCAASSAAASSLAASCADRSAETRAGSEPVDDRWADEAGGRPPDDRMSRANCWCCEVTRVDSAGLCPRADGSASPDP